ncbi:MAG TPA: redoxin domain-containing protein [Streptosporangiaceae bacterium]|nr:redoxin domain-containing protein [Streptosporangiaceae bacterium]
MSLEDELEARRQRAYAQRSPEERKVRAAAVTAVANAQTAERALGEGEPIPRFQLPSIEGGLADAGLLLERGPLVISFYRGGWCPYCNIELRSLQRWLPDIEALGASLVAISPEMPDRTLMTVQSDALTFPVLFDKGNEVARQFRLTHQIDPQVVRYQLGNGNDVAAYNGMDTAEVPLPATYVIGADGVVRYAFVDADYTRRADPEVLVGVLRDLAAERDATSGAASAPASATGAGTVAMSSEQITAEVLAAISRANGTRAGEILSAVIRHTHDLAREVRLQPGELLAAADFLRRCGDISDEARHEYILLSDVLGLTMVVDTEAAGVADGALETSVLGPFYRAGAPWQPNGANISRGTGDGEPARIHGRILDTSGTPVTGAVLDVWGTNGHGLYENVDPSQPDYNLRGRFRSAADGSYDLWTVKPVSYPIPDDGPVGELLAVTGRHNMRPAHFHVIASADGYQSVVTELYTDDDPYLGSDAVFGVKPSLVVHYDHIDDSQALAAAGRSAPYWDLEYDFILTPGQASSAGFSTGRRRAV